MDHTIEVWTFSDTHHAQCTCGWIDFSASQSVLESMVRKHRKQHADKGDSTEVV